MRKRACDDFEGNSGMPNPKTNAGKLRMAPSPYNLHIPRWPPKIKKNINCCKLAYVKDSKLQQNYINNIL